MKKYDFMLNISKCGLYSRLYYVFNVLQEM